MAAAGSATSSATAGADTDSRALHTALQNTKLEDGTATVDTAERDAAFMKWLADNGADTSPLQWPTRDTIGGVRGAVALKDIEPGEPMMHIPAKLLMSPPAAAKSELAPVLERFASVFKHDEDRLLALFIMHEKIKGEASFWAPFLNMLPDPTTICDWTTAELSELQDQRLALEAVAWNGICMEKYESLFPAMAATFPDLVDWSKFTYELFRWSVLTVDARAFGRRLPWTALVPFADCLNHANVATKYDFDVAGNGMFRLFPTGSNRYPKGTEAFNSYGRRDNRHLLMNYGFAICGNMWETLSTVCFIPESDPDFSVKSAAMGRFFFTPMKSYRLKWNTLNLEVLSYFRLATLTAAQHQDPELQKMAFCGIVSAENEVAALHAAIEHYRKDLRKFPTTLADDLQLLTNGSPAPRLATAVAHRITHKQMLVQQIDLLSALLQLANVTMRLAQLPRPPVVLDPVVSYVQQLVSTTAPSTEPEL